MSISQRSERLRLYTYADGGSDGVVDPTYTYRETVWGRITDRSGLDVMVGGTPEERIDAVASIDMRLTVNKTDAIRGPDGGLYFVTHLARRRTLQEWQLGLRRVDLDETTANVVGDV